MFRQEVAIENEGVQMEKGRVFPQERERGEVVVTQVQMPNFTEVRENVWRKKREALFSCVCEIDSLIRRRSHSEKKEKGEKEKNKRE